jgi:hypothetical protein
MTTTDPVAETGRLRLELEHKDQLMASVYARADTLQAVVERLERQLEAAIEAQRDAATERSELRRLLGNAQLQVHALMQLPAPEAKSEESHQSDGRASTVPVTAQFGGPNDVSNESSATPRQPSRSSARARTRQRRAESRGLIDEARGMLSSLWRII